MRTFIALLMLLAGLALVLVSYLYLVTPLELPDSPISSNPRLVGAPASLLWGIMLGMMLVFLSAVAYELIPDRKRAVSEAEKAADTSGAAPQLTPELTTLSEDSRPA